MESACPKALARYLHMFSLSWPAVACKNQEFQLPQNAMPELPEVENVRLSLRAQGSWDNNLPK